MKDIVKIVFNKLRQFYHSDFIKILGRIISIAAIIYIVLFLFNLSNSIDKNIISPHLIIAFIVSIIGGVFCVLIYTLSYQNILKNVSNTSVSFRPIAILYLKSNVFKYVPSNVMHYVGRNVLANSFKLSQRDILKSSVIEILNTVIVTVTFCASIFAWNYSPILSFIIIGIVFCIYRVKKLELSFCLILFTSFITNSFVVMFYSIITGAGFITSFSNISIIQSISWLAGFLTPGAPGGIGIKEFVMLHLGNADISKELAIIAVIQRISSIITDILGFLISILLTRMNKYIQ